MRDTMGDPADIFDVRVLGKVIGTSLLKVATTNRGWSFYDFVPAKNLEGSLAALVPCDRLWIDLCTNDFLECFDLYNATGTDTENSLRKVPVRDPHVFAMG